MSEKRKQFSPDRDCPTPSTCARGGYCREAEELRRESVRENIDPALITLTLSTSKCNHRQMTRSETYARDVLARHTRRN